MPSSKTIFTVSVAPLSDLRDRTIVVVLIFMLSSWLFALLIISLRILRQSSYPFQESMAVLPIATIRSPFVSLRFAAGVFGNTLSISAGIKGRANTGCSFSIVRRLMSSGMLISFFSPWRITVTVFASAIARYMSISNLSMFSPSAEIMMSPS